MLCKHDSASLLHLVYKKGGARLSVVVLTRWSECPQLVVRKMKKETTLETQYQLNKYQCISLSFVWMDTLLVPFAFPMWNDHVDGAIQHFPIFDISIRKHRTSPLARRRRASAPSQLSLTEYSIDCDCLSLSMYTTTDEANILLRKLKIFSGRSRLFVGARGRAGK